MGVFFLWGGPEGHQKTVHTISLASSVVAPSSTEDMFVAAVGSLKPGSVRAETFHQLVEHWRNRETRFETSF